MQLSRNLETLTSWNPLGPSGPVIGLLLHFYISHSYCTPRPISSFGCLLLYQTKSHVIEPCRLVVLRSVCDSSAQQSPTTIEHCFWKVPKLSNMCLKISMVYWWNGTDWGKSKYWEQKLSLCPFIYHNFDARLFFQPQLVPRK